MRRGPLCRFLHGRTGGFYPSSGISPGLAGLAPPMEPGRLETVGEGWMAKMFKKAIKDNAEGLGVTVGG